MLKCDQVAAQASEYLDRQLSPMQRLEFRLHLFMCQNCRRFLKQLDLLNQSLSQRAFAQPAPAQVSQWLDAVSKQQRGE